MLSFLLYHPPNYFLAPGGSDGKEFTCNAGDQGLIPGSGRSPGEGNGNPFQYFCLENSMAENPGRVTKSWTSLSD